MKKRIIALVTSIGLLVGLSGCNDFGDVNKDPENITNETMDYTYMFTNVQKYVYGTEYEVWRNAIIYITSMLQQTASTDSYFNGDKYTYNSGYNAAFWDRQYEREVPYVVDVLHAWKDDPAKVPEYQMARIMRVVLMQRMTDLYGDVPYSQAGLGYIEGISDPVYDTQEYIYMDMLNELKEAGEILASVSSSTIGSQDIMYGGDVTKWKKFCYSLMVRVAMRLTKVQPTTAETWVNTAITGGIFESNADNGIMYHDGASVTNDTPEPYAKVFAHEAPNDYRMGETFIDMLKNTNDPRLSYIATVVENPRNGYSSGDYELGDTTATRQIGMPNGYDQQNAGTDISTVPNYPGDINDYLVVNRYTYSNPTSPTLVLTYSTIQLLLAEAAYRGWISGSAEDYYRAGVTAAMKQFTVYGVPEISDARINTYLTQNAYNASTALEQINTQYYIATFCDAYETFANWRRSGYPQLTLVNYIGNVTNGTIPRRFTYEVEEANVNAEHYLEAVRRLDNGDTMTSRVWWDVQ
ncbi:MAG: SusD/RagB family nutrient-binding outer membrane lipoprotein [Tannerellaceae bacterium]|nr:SusD/RagB family nutrient-binding outer membrane lipoprotein [Tannerellaceae bacterium]